MKEDKARLLELDALRGIAALLVVFFHYTMNRSQAEYGFKLGVTGTDLFFIISGFVIFLSLTQKPSWKQFVVNRFARLYPAYWVCVTITMMLMLFSNHQDPKEFILITWLGNLTMLQHYLNFYDLDGPYWTLIIELLFYGFILSVFLLKKMDKILVIGSVFLLFCLFYNYVLQNKAGFLFDIIKDKFPLVNHFPLFFAGILFYKIKFEERSLKYYAGVAACFVVAFSLFESSGRSNQYINIYEYLFILFLYFLIWMLYVNDKLSFIVNKQTLFLGKISYSLYLIHQFIGTKIIIRYFVDRNISFWIGAIAALCVSICIAALVTFCVERPCVNYFKRRMEAGVPVAL